jgi:hypothetical protein
MAFLKDGFIHKIAIWSLYWVHKMAFILIHKMSFNLVHKMAFFLVQALSFILVHKMAFIPVHKMAFILVHIMSFDQDHTMAFILVYKMYLILVHKKPSFWFTRDGLHSGSYSGSQEAQNPIPPPPFKNRIPAYLFTQGRGKGES